jgi:Icc-related predicted phosphoesterase
VSTLRILAFSDLHDEEDALERLSTVAATAKPEFDAIFITGDTTNESYSFLEKAITAFGETPVFWVPGNNEPPTVLKKAAKLGHYVHGKQAALSKFSVVGFGMSPHTPFGTPNELPEDEIYSAMTRLPIDSNTFLITHAPPLGYFDMTGRGSGGSSAVRRIVEEKQPLAIFCGHIHEHEGVKLLGKTNVVKLAAARDYGYAVVDINDDKNVRVQFLKL